MCFSPMAQSMARFVLVLSHRLGVELLRPLQIGRDWSLAMANDTPKKRAKEAAKYNSLIFSS